MAELKISVVYGPEQQQDISFHILTVPALTPDMAKKVNYGQWFCQSPYYGKTYSGKYYLKNVESRCRSQEERWATNCRHMSNPVGFFFDNNPTDSTMSFKEPFLFLENLRLSESSKLGGFGEILIYGQAQPVGNRLHWIMQ